MCIAKIIHNLRDLLRESPKESPGECQGNSVGLHVAVVVALYSVYGPHIAVHDHADLLIRTVEIRVANIDGNQTHTQSVQRDDMSCSRCEGKRVACRLTLLVALEHISQLAKRIGARRS